MVILQGRVKYFRSFSELHIDTEFRNAKRGTQTPT